MKKGGRRYSPLLPGFQLRSFDRFLPGEVLPIRTSEEGLVEPPSWILGAREGWSSAKSKSEATRGQTTMVETAASFS